MVGVDEHRELARQIAVLRREADEMEAVAAEIYATAPRLYGGGSFEMVAAVDEADGYRREAAQWRAQAAQAEKHLIDMREDA